MTDPKETLAKDPTPKADTQPPVSQPPGTSPVEQHRRLTDEEIELELCTIDDMPEIGLYICFADRFLDRMEPPEIRDGDVATRAKRLGMRLGASIHLEKMKWVKAVYRPTGRIVGAAGWALPGMPVHNVWRHSAFEFYGFKQLLGWSDADVDELWRGVDVKAWDTQIGGNDVIRADVLKDEPHWFLAPLITLPEFRGRGVASRLLKWAIDQADKAEPAQTMYLESSPMARDVYMRFGFVPIGKANFVRRGPGGVRGGESVGEVGVGVVEKEMDAGLVD